MYDKFSKIHIKKVILTFVSTNCIEVRSNKHFGVFTNNILTVPGTVAPDPTRKANRKSRSIAPHILIFGYR